MKEKVKKLWLEALRSDKYKQGTGFLKTMDNEYCCLGVLCDVYAKTQKKKGFQKDETGIYFFEDKNSMFNKNSMYLPKQVISWSGLKDNSPIITIDFSNRKLLANLNDKEKLSFNEIADLIEKHL